MSLFDNLGIQQPMTMEQALQQLRADPAGALKQAGMNIPAGMNDPQMIINHLAQSGQLPQNRLAMAMQIARRMGLR